MPMNYSESPNWVQCESPQNQSYNGYDSSVASPGNSNNNFYGSSVASPGNSDNNYYGSPPVSPGNWDNVVSPNTTSSAHDMASANSSYASPNSSVYSNGSASTPSATPSPVSSHQSPHYPIALPEKLGQENNLSKTALDCRRERVANVKALGLMNEAVRGSPVKRPDVRSSSLSARQAAIRRYEEKKRNPNQNVHHQPPALAPRKEKLASSTRKKKQLTAEEDFETIDDYKYPLDFDREKAAQSKALALLEAFGF